MVFVNERNAAVALRLDKRHDALLAFHQSEVASTLNVTFLSTNLIENALRSYRRLGPSATGYCNDLGTSPA